MNLITSSRKWSRRRLSRGSSPPQQQHQPSSQQQQQQQQSPHLLGLLQRLRRTSLLRSTEEPAAEAAEAAGTKAEEEEAADKPITSQDVNWQEADFSFEDAPPRRQRNRSPPAWVARTSPLLPRILRMQTQKCKPQIHLQHLTSAPAVSGKAVPPHKGERRRELCL